VHPNKLDLKELLEFDPEGGVIRFAGQRALVLDAVAMGLLRKYLVENFGQTAARIVLTQFGFAHGWRMAEAMQAEFKWADKDEWRAAGTRIHTLEGLFGVVSGSNDPLSEKGSTLVASYEAEQHLLHFGRASHPVCWTICGLISGYISRTAGENVFVIEDRCTGQGDPACHLVGRTAAEWGHERAPELSYFEQDRLKASLDVSLDRVTKTLKAAERKLQTTRRALVRAAPDVGQPFGIVTKSEAMRHLLDLTQRVAKVDSTVLITGPSGSGKERIARLLHQESARASGPFIAVNCAAITETLLESELFGHARGAFTGATHDRAGLFEAANSGTLLLDEIGEVSAGMQVKLLRVLQEREVRRVGENRSRKVDVRVLAATNRDLSTGVAGGEFRKDLYYRLRVVELKLPPLCERVDDILPLARTLLADAALRMTREISTLSPGAADQLLRHSWPGNVRELENAMEHAVALARGKRVELEDLPEEIRNASPRSALTMSSVQPLREIEKEYILAALKHNDGNQTRTADQLCVGSATLYRKLKSYGLVPGRRAHPSEVL
jgi:DNA-binding NtrC family response regulator